MIYDKFDNFYNYYLKNYINNNFLLINNIKMYTLTIHNY